MKMAPSAFHYGSKITQHPSYDSSLMLILMPGCHDVCHLTVDVKWIGMITADDQLNHNDACMTFFFACGICDLHGGSWQLMKFWSKRWIPGALKAYMSVGCVDEILGETLTLHACNAQI